MKLRLQLSRRRSRPCFVDPHGQPGSVLTLTDVFEHTRQLRWALPDDAVFSTPSPEVLAGPLDELMTLAGDRRAREWVERAVVVLTRWSDWEQDRVLEDEDRDRFWRGFRVPVFEYLISPEGELLAAECEAHDGLHVHAASEWLKAASHQMAHPVHLHWKEARCACDSSAPRLMVSRSVQFSTAIAR
jgi:hypothetical protein